MSQPPSVDNYTIWDVGTGILYMAEWCGDKPPLDIDNDVGNVVSIKIKNIIKRSPKYKTINGKEYIHENQAITIGYSILFKLDEICDENLKLFASATKEKDILHGFQNVNTHFALKFVSKTQVGAKKTWIFWKASLTTKGYVSLIGKDRWMGLSFKVDGLADLENHPESPLYDIVERK